MGMFNRKKRKLDQVSGSQFKAEPLSLSALENLIPHGKSGHTVYACTFDGQEGFYKENKHGKARASELEVLFSALWPLMLGAEHTARVRLVKNDSGEITGVFVDKKPGFAELPKDVDVSDLVDKGIVLILVMAYFMMEDDLHRGNLGLVIKEIIELVFKIDHDMNWNKILMQEGLARIYHAFEDRFSITTRDIQNFPDLKDANPHYWPTIRRWFKKSPGFDRKSRRQFKNLTHDEGFNGKKYLYFQKILCIDIELIKNKLAECVNDDSPDITRIADAFAERQAYLQANLLSVPGFHQKLKQNKENYLKTISDEITTQHSNAEEPGIRNNIKNKFNEIFEYCDSEEAELDDTPLHIAVRFNNLRDVLNNKSIKIYLHIKNKQGFTPIQLACHLGNYDAYNKLKQAGANAHYGSNRRRTKFYLRFFSVMYAFEKTPRIAILLFENRVSKKLVKHAIDKTAKLPLFIAISAPHKQSSSNSKTTINDVKLVDEFLTRFKASQYVKQRALMLAVNHNKFDIILSLLNHDPSLQNWLLSQDVLSEDKKDFINLITLIYKKDWKSLEHKNNQKTLLRFINTLIDNSQSKTLQILENATVLSAESKKSLDLHYNKAQSKSIRTFVNRLIGVPLQSATKPPTPPPRKGKGVTTAPTGTVRTKEAIRRITDSADDELTPTNIVTVINASLSYDTSNEAYLTSIDANNIAHCFEASLLQRFNGDAFDFIYNNALSSYDSIGKEKLLVAALSSTLSQLISDSTLSISDRKKVTLASFQSVIPKINHRESLVAISKLLDSEQNKFIRELQSKSSILRRIRGSYGVTATYKTIHYKLYYQVKKSNLTNKQESKLDGDALSQKKALSELMNKKLGFFSRFVRTKKIVLPMYTPERQGSVGLSKSSH